MSSIGDKEREGAGPRLLVVVWGFGQARFTNPYFFQSMYFIIEKTLKIRYMILNSQSSNVHHCPSLAGGGGFAHTITLISTAVASPRVHV